MKALNDKLMLSDVLAHLKDLMQACTDGTKHSSCPNMRAVVAKVCERTTQNQFNLFKYMNENNMYPIKNCTDQELRECIQMHEQACPNDCKGCKK